MVNIEIFGLFFLQHFLRLGAFKNRIDEWSSVEFFIAVQLERSQTLVKTICLSLFTIHHSPSPNKTFLNAR
jgi:hypothetical protein